MSEAESQIEETGVKSEQTVECRACLQILNEDCVLYNIFEGWTSPWDGMENSIAEDLAKIANVQISQSDRHSKIICETCYQLLLSACSFTAIVKRNNEILRQRYRQDKTQTNLSNDGVWPKPIQVDKLMASSMYGNVDNKKEFVSDDEQYPTANGSYDPSRDDLPILDIIKIEPEKFTQQQPSQQHVAVNGNEELNPLNTNESHLTNGNSDSGRLAIMEPQPSTSKGTPTDLNSSKKKRPMMESRIKRFVNLALTTENSNIPVVGISADKDATLSSTDARSKKRADLLVPNRHRCDSASSSRSSSSDSSSSSTSSTNTFFNEDSDDSVKDPNYEVVEPQRHNQSSSSDSDGEVDNVNKIHNDGLLQEIGIRTEDHEPILNRLVQEADAVPIANEPSPVEYVKSTEQNSQNPVCSPNKKGKKRRRLEGSLKKNIAKRLKNSGNSYQSVKTKKIVPERKLRPPCRENCPFKCRSNITDDQRQLLLKEFWNLGDIKKQWTSIANSIETVIPKHRHVKINSDGNIALSRDNNNAFFFTVSGIKTRVCKVFFKNTLAINDWPIVTALKKKNKDCNVSSMKDDRGNHGNQCKVNENIKKGVKTFLEAIPKIESHYIRANSRRHYIDSGKAITDLHRDYVAECKSKNVPFASYAMFYRIFTQDNKISFFVPQKDLCDVCEAYKNSTDEEKERLKENYETHQNEKVLSRVEKENDKKNSEILVAVYDFQPVFQCPKGDISFYYKSKLNVLNLTIYNIQSNCFESYVWDESNAHRGVNEIGTCVYKYLVKISETIENLDVVFYSGNCWDQHKNEFMICMYLYAAKTIPNLNSVTHKYLIEGHTQNEGDCAHFQIEREIKRQLRSGPLYTPDAFIGALKAARKNREPFHVNEMCFADFYDWKSLTNQMNFSLLEDENNDSVKLSGLKVIRVQKSDPEAIFFKDSYADKQFKKAIVIKKKNVISNLELKNAYNQKPGICDKKKADLMDLVNKNLIPGYHRPFYECL